MSGFVNALDILQKPLTFGNPWHGYEKAGAIWTPENQLISLPADQHYQRAGDGIGYLVDFGLPAITQTEAETAAGMRWSSQAVLCGSDLSGQPRIYNPVRGTAANAITFGACSFPYRCADGAIYQVYLDKIAGTLHALRLTMPWPARASAPVLATLPEYDNDVAEFRTEFTMQPALCWINHAPNGSAFAVHVGFCYGGELYVYQIYEYTVIGGNDTSAPTISLVKYWCGDIAKTGAAMTVTETLINTLYQDETLGAQNGITVGQEKIEQRWLLLIEYSPAGQRLAFSRVTTTDNIFNAPAFFPINDVDQGYTQTWSVSTVGSYRVGSSDKVIFKDQFDEFYLNATTPPGVRTVVRNYLAYDAFQVFQGRVLLILAAGTGIARDASGQITQPTADLAAAIATAGAIGKTSQTAGAALGLTNLTNTALDPRTGAFSTSIARYF